MPLVDIYLLSEILNTSKSCKSCRLPEFKDALYMYLHMPKEQVTPGAQTLKQVPQCAGLDSKSVQTPPQQDSKHKNPHELQCWGWEDTSMQVRLRER